MTTQTNIDGDRFDSTASDPCGLVEGGQGRDLTASVELSRVAWWLVRFALTVIGAARVCVWLYHAVRL